MSFSCNRYQGRVYKEVYQNENVVAYCETRKNDDIMFAYVQNKYYHGIGIWNQNFFVFSLSIA